MVGVIIGVINKRITSSTSCCLSFDKSSQGGSAAALPSSGLCSRFDAVVNKIPFGSAGFDLSAFDELVHTFFFHLSELVGFQKYRYFVVLLFS